MTSGPPTASSLLTEWSPDWLVLALVVATGGGYLLARRRAGAIGLRWTLRRDVTFWVALALTVWVSCGFLNARATQLLWVWTTQQLVLLLILPIIVLAAQPLQLLRRVNPRSTALRLLFSPPARVLGNPLVGPVLVPVLCTLLFFGGLGEVAASNRIGGSLLAIGLLAIGTLIAIPLADADDARSSLAVGAALAVGFVELILDAFPGIALRFQTHLTIPFFGVHRPAWAGGWLDDQHIAGGILWIVSELLDLPFLVLAATRWTRADAREAAVIDAELDARDLRRLAQAPADASTSDEQQTVGRPWWMDDPNLQRRFRS